MDFIQELGFDLKKVDTVDNPTHRINDEESGECYIEINLLTNKDNCEMFHAKVNTVCQHTVEEYSKMHRLFCKKRFSENKEFILCYDLRGGDIPFDFDILKSLASMKQSLSAEYEKSLICTIVLVESEAIQTILNTLLTTMYRPVRPVRLVKTPSDALNFISFHTKDRIDKDYCTYSEE